MRIPGRGAGGSRKMLFQVTPHRFGVAIPAVRRRCSPLSTTYSTPLDRPPPRMQMMPGKSLTTSLKRKRRAFKSMSSNALRLRFRLVSPVRADLDGKSAILTTSLKRKRRAFKKHVVKCPSLALQACKPGSGRLGREVSSSDPALWYSLDRSNAFRWCNSQSGTARCARGSRRWFLPDPDRGCTEVSSSRATGPARCRRAGARPRWPRDGGGRSRIRR